MPALEALVQPAAIVDNRTTQTSPEPHPRLPALARPGARRRSLRPIRVGPGPNENLRRMPASCEIEIKRPRLP
jgi:hypothetical protein